MERDIKIEQCRIKEKGQQKTTQKNKNKRK